MSYFEYQIGKKLALQGYPLAALIMAAMRIAEGDDREILKKGWPDIWQELDHHTEAFEESLGDEIPDSSNE